MTTEEQLDKCIEDLDKAYRELAFCQPDRDYSTEMKKTVLNMQKTASGATTEAGKERKAYCSEEWKEYLWQAFLTDVRYYKAVAEVKILEKRFDHLRTKNKNEREMTNRTI